MRWIITPVSHRYREHVANYSGTRVRLVLKVTVALEKALNKVAKMGAKLAIFQHSAGTPSIPADLPFFIFLIAT